MFLIVWEGTGSCVCWGEAGLCRQICVLPAGTCGGEGVCFDFPEKILRAAGLGGGSAKWVARRWEVMDRVGRFDGLAAESGGFSNGFGGIWQGV